MLVPLLREKMLMLFKIRHIWAVLRYANFGSLYSILKKLASFSWISGLFLISYGRFNL
jgi:hypothetical protein